MRDETACRRPGFRSGLTLRQADGQVWSLPLPGGPPQIPQGSGDGWDGPEYRAILAVVAAADDQGELFRAELALAIYLLRWNYSIDEVVLEELLDGRHGGGSPAEVAGVLHELSSAHVKSLLGPTDEGHRPSFEVNQGDFLRGINGFVSRLKAHGGRRENEGSADLTA